MCLRLVDGGEGVGVRVELGCGVMVMRMMGSRRYSHAGTTGLNGGGQGLRLQFGDCFLGHVYAYRYPASFSFTHSASLTVLAYGHGNTCWSFRWKSDIRN